jgi:hypothetical protein
MSANFVRNIVFINVRYRTTSRHSEDRQYLYGFSASPSEVHIQLHRIRVSGAGTIVDV